MGIKFVINGQINLVSGCNVNPSHVLIQPASSYVHAYLYIARYEQKSKLFMHVS